MIVVIVCQSFAFNTWTTSRHCIFGVKHAHPAIGQFASECIVSYAFIEKYAANDQMEDEAN